MQSNTSETRFLGTVEAAAFINRHRSTLDKWRAENIVLPYYRDCGKIMYAISDLKQYLDSCRVEPIAYGCPDVAQDNNWAA